MSDSKRPCPACGHQESRDACTRDGVRFVRCADCGTMYHAAPPNWERIERIYQEDYHKRRGHGGDAAVEAAKQVTTLAYLRMVERLHPPGRNLVKVGCSAGAGLAAAAAAGWEATGVEVSRASAEIAAKRPGVRAVHTGRLEDAPLPDGQVDVFTFFDVIEHIDPPQPTLATIRRLLRPGGLVLMVTPEGDCPSARLMGARWPHLFEEHVVLFSRRGLRRALEQVGLRVERCGFAWKRVNLDVLVRHAHLHPHIWFGGVLRTLGRILPRWALAQMFPFNIGEFYIIARRPRA